jgi:hypothetical protein
MSAEQLGGVVVFAVVSRYCVGFWGHVVHDAGIRL